MMEGPKSAVFTTVRARDGHLFHLDMHLARLAKHADILGITVPNFEIPEGLDGLVKIQIHENGLNFTPSHSIKRYTWMQKE